jgi:hypothetical protein
MSATAVAIEPLASRIVQLVTKFEKPSTVIKREKKLLIEIRDDFFCVSQGQSGETKELWLPGEKEPWTGTWSAFITHFFEISEAYMRELLGEERAPRKKKPIEQTKAFKQGKNVGCEEGYGRGVRDAEAKHAKKTASEYPKTGDPDEGFTEDGRIICNGVPQGVRDATLCTAN